MSDYSHLLPHHRATAEYLDDLFRKDNPPRKGDPNRAMSEENYFRELFGEEPVRPAATKSGDELFKEIWGDPRGS
jgi:hypothetical protein